MERRHEFAGRGRRVLGFLPALDVGQFKSLAGNGWRDG